MKIEIVNRSHWRKRVKQLLEEIEEYNARVLWDRDYILAQLENKQWDKYHGRPKWLRWLIGPRSLKIGEVMYYNHSRAFLKSFEFLQCWNNLPGRQRRLDRKTFLGY